MKSKIKLNYDSNIIVIIVFYIIVLLYCIVEVFAADMTVPSLNPVVRAWVCGYTAGYNDGTRDKTEPKSMESISCEKYRSMVTSANK